jgi:hypothetical protein
MGVMDRVAHGGLARQDLDGEQVESKGHDG